MSILDEVVAAVTPSSAEAEVNAIELLTKDHDESMRCSATMRRSPKAMAMPTKSARYQRESVGCWQCMPC